MEARSIVQKQLDLQIALRQFKLLTEEEKGIVMASLDSHEARIIKDLMNRMHQAIKVRSDR